MSQEVQVEIEMEELLSSEAFLCACEAAFREADENGDGVLQKSEVHSQTL